VNEVVQSLGVGGWKPLVGTLLLPPVPMLVLVLAGAGLMSRHRLKAWVLVVLGCAGLWFAGTEAAAVTLERWAIKPPPPLTAAGIAALKDAPKTAIVVLGAGRKQLALEYGQPGLKPWTAERLRYGIYLARRTGLPLAFSGGVGHGAPPGPSEAEIAARVASNEFGFKMRWTETRSRDTHENAVRSVALLRAQGIEHIVVVTQGLHMPRALRNFQTAAAAATVGNGSPLRITAASMDMTPDGDLQFADYLPSFNGHLNTRLALHEWFGRLFGA